MKYDVIVIGGGMAGYTAAIRCLEKGQKTALINNGRSALHFSSGSVELLAKTPVGKAVRYPLDEISRFNADFPEHPYAKIGAEKVTEAIGWFREMMNQAGVPLNRAEGNENHQRITTLGTLKSTYLSQPFTEQIAYKEAKHSFERILIVSLEGFRDFQSHVIADNLRENELFSHLPVSVLPINPVQDKRDANSFRSTDFAQLLNHEPFFLDFANQIAQRATTNDLIVVPAIFGTAQGLEVLHRLKVYTGLRFHEVPTMPPSQMGIRLEEALESRFVRLGGILLKGDCVTRGEFSPTATGLRLKRIWTNNLRDYPLIADEFILATGSFFSNGLRAEREQIVEPVFNLDIFATSERSKWYDSRFFTPGSHAFMTFGVKTNEKFQPRLQGNTVKNLYCCGSILPHYNPVAEGSGGGVAISSAYFIVDKVTAGQETQVMLETEEC